MLVLSTFTGLDQGFLYDRHRPLRTVAVLRVHVVLDGTMQGESYEYAGTIPSKMNYVPYETVIEFNYSHVFREE